MKPYPRKFESYEDAKAYLSTVGKLHYFGVEVDKYVFNFHHGSGKKYHMLIHQNGSVEYKEMSPIQYAHWRGEGW